MPAMLATKSNHACAPSAGARPSAEAGAQVAPLLRAATPLLLLPPEHAVGTMLFAAGAPAEQARSVADERPPHK